MSKTPRDRAFATAGNAEIPSNATSDVPALLHETVAHLEQAMRLLAQATLLSPALDESLGIEAQRLIGVSQAIAAEIETIEQQNPPPPKPRAGKDAQVPDATRARRG